MAAACRQRVERYSVAAATTGLVGACEEIVSRRARQTGAHDAPPRVLALCGLMSIVSGLERMTFEVLRVLREQGGPVHCITNTWANWDWPSEPHPIAARAEAIGASWSTSSYLHAFSRRPGLVQTLRLTGDILRTSTRLLVDAWRFRPTHVFVPEFTSVLRHFPALILLRLTGTTVVMRLGNAPAPGPFYRRLWRLVINPVVDRFVCNSKYTAGELLAHGIPAAKVTQIYNTAPARAVPPSNGVLRDPGRVIYVGQVIPEKGPDLLLEAVGLVVSRGCDARLDVVGAIDDWAAPPLVRYRNALRERASRPDLAGRVRFLGEREDVPALLKGAAIHCVPSRPEQREGFGIVVVEAKEAGLPSVVLPTGALPELIAHGETGWICRDTTADALADGLEYFLVDADRCARAGRAAQASAAAFDRTRFAEAWSAVFAEAH